MNEASKAVETFKRVEAAGNDHTTLKRNDSKIRPCEPLNVVSGAGFVLHWILERAHRHILVMGVCFRFEM